MTQNIKTACWLFKNCAVVKEKRLDHEMFSWADNFKVIGANSVAEELYVKKALRAVEDYSKHCYYETRRGYTLVKIDFTLDHNNKATLLSNEDEQDSFNDLGV